MSSTNQTTNLKLSQFGANSKPTWLTDYNGDMQKIDEGFGEIKETGDSNATAITNLQQSVTAVDARVTENASNIQQNTANISLLDNKVTSQGTTVAGIQNDLEDLTNTVDNEVNEQWILMAASDGVGIKDGTWHTSYIGYAMESLGKTEGTDFFVATENGTGLINLGAQGHNYLQLLQQVIMPQITNKNKIKKIFINMLANLGSSSAADLTTAASNFVSYVKTQFPNAEIIHLRGHRPWAWQSTNTTMLSMLSVLNSLGIKVEYETVISNRNRSWYQSDYIHLNDDGQHACGQRIVNAYLGGTIFTRFPYRTIDPTSIIMANGWTIKTTGNEWRQIVEAVYSNDRIFFDFGLTMVNPAEQTIPIVSTSGLKVMENPFNYINNGQPNLPGGSLNCMFFLNSVSNGELYHGRIQISDNSGVTLSCLDKALTVPASTPLIVRMFEKEIFYPWC